MISFKELITMAVQRGASDLHLTTGIPAMARIDGSLTPLLPDILSPEDVETLAKSIMNEKQIRTLDEKGEVDFAHSERATGRFRINVFMQRNTYAMVARVLNLRIPDPLELGISNSVVGLCDKMRGIVLVTGPTGSGKSTTLASLINEINRKRKRHIITLEDPIEYLHRHQNSVVNQREVGSDTNGFPPALRAALRQDPDVILVGEMRDLETISVAVTAAETGHLVFSTLHTVGAANTIDRIIDVFPPGQQQQIRTQLADVLEAVVSQQLIPKIGGGRAAAFEVMFSNSAIRNNIREAKTYQIPSVIMTNARVGMKTMDDSILELYQNNMITGEDAMMYAQDPTALARRLI